MKMLLNSNELCYKTSREPIALQCEICNKIFHKPKNQVLSYIKRNKGGSFCSLNCSNKDRNERSNSKKITIKCFLCGKQIEKRKYEVLERNFCSRKCTATHYGQLNKKPKQIRNPKPIIPLIHKKCSLCDSELLRSWRDVRNSKTKTFFCNKSCKTKYLHKFQIKHKCRSKAETYLCNLIKTEFPNFEIQENVRTILSGSLEIDIFLPSKKLAIELNGPVHFFPIWGQETLEKVQNKDLRKQIEIQKLGLNLLVVDISRLNSTKKTEKFLDEYFVSHIKAVIEAGDGANLPANTCSYTLDTSQTRPLLGNLDPL